MLDRTSFIGREKEYTDIQQLFAQPEYRLLTLVCPGGIGETRLALLSWLLSPSATNLQLRRLVQE